MINQYPKEFRRIADISIPDKMFQPIKTNNPEMDAVLSELGGLVPSQVIMVTGNPGSGKTTISAVVGAKVAAAIPDKPVVFLSYEMSDFQLKLQAAKIPGFSSLLISTHEFHKDDAGLDSLFKALDSIDPSLVIVDSLQKMASKMAHGPTRGQIVLVERFTKWAKKTFTPVILIGHNDKGGNYAGPSFLKHEVDSHMLVWVDKESRERLFAMSKNRFGGNMEQYGFRIDRNGVYIGSEWWTIVDNRTDDETMDIVMDFKNSGNSPKLNWDKFQETATSLVNYLKKHHAPRFARETFVKSPSHVKLSWAGKRAFCAYKQGKINFGRQFFDRVNDDNFRAIGYKSEKPYIAKFVSNKEEAAIWVILHEWTHLFVGYQRHSSHMWREISRLAASMPWLWSRLRPA